MNIKLVPLILSHNIFVVFRCDRVLWQAKPNITRGMNSSTYVYIQCMYICMYIFLDL